VKILYIDMDGVLVDFQTGVDCLDEDIKMQYNGRLDEVPGIYNLMLPKEGAIDAFKKLSQRFDTYILSTAPWENESAWSDKLLWVKKYLGDIAKKRLILSHNKQLNKGHFLVDDRLKNGAEFFEGELILFGSESFPDWNYVLKYLIKND
jgi:5'-nucleotidase